MTAEGRPDPASGWRRPGQPPVCRPDAGHQEQREAVGLDGGRPRTGAGGPVGVPGGGIGLGAAERWGRVQGTQDVRLGPGWRRPIREEGKGYWLLVHRSVSQPEELAYYVCYGLGETTPEELVKVAGIRWTIEERFEEAKGLVELDQYEVRRWEGWCRHVTLAMLAHAYLG